MVGMALKADMEEGYKIDREERIVINAYSEEREDIGQGCKA